MVFSIALLFNPTILSYCLSNQVARLRLKRQLILFSARSWFNFSSHIAFLKHHAAPADIDPWSTYTFSGLPFIGVNLLRRKMNSWVLMIETGNCYGAQCMLCLQLSIPCCLYLCGPLFEIPINFVRNRPRMQPSNCLCHPFFQEK